MENSSLIYKLIWNLNNNNLQVAKECAEIIIKNNPNDSEGHAWLAAIYGKIMENGAMMDKITYLPLLQTELEIALKLDPKSILAKRVNGIRLVYTPEGFGNDPQIAIEELNYVIDEGIQEAEIYYALGLAYVQLDDEKNAQCNFKKALEYDKNYTPAIQQLELLNL
jgi:tetratricopeptide (TPR) repeat protein